MDKGDSSWWTVDGLLISIYHINQGWWLHVCDCLVYAASVNNATLPAGHPATVGLVGCHPPPLNAACLGSTLLPCTFQAQCTPPLGSVRHLDAGVLGKAADAFEKPYSVLLSTFNLQLAMYFSHMQQLNIWICSIRNKSTTLKVLAGTIW